MIFFTLYISVFLARLFIYRGYYSARFGRFSEELFKVFMGNLF